MGKGPEQTFFQRRHADGQQVHEKVLNITNHQGNANQNLNDRSIHACDDPTACSCLTKNSAPAATL